MKSIGETLRGERVRRHLDIPGISRELKIPARFLEAIEKEQFDKLPAPVFARSFVRQYARYLGLPEDELVSALQHLMEPPPSTAESTGEKMESPAIQVDRMAEWESVGERRSWSSSLPALALVVVAMLACSGIYAWWQRNRHAVSAHDQPQSASVGQVPDALTAPSAAVLPPVRPAPPPNTAEPLVQPVSTADREAAPTGVPANPPLTEASKPAGGTVAPEPSTGPPGPVHVELTANSQVWISAKADDKTAFIGTLEANQKRIVDAQKTIVLRLGNAGGADIILNGKSIGPVGPKGQPRTVQLTSGGFQIVASPSAPGFLDPLR